MLCALFDDNCSIENLWFRTFSLCAFTPLSALIFCLQIFFMPLYKFMKCRMVKCENYWCRFRVQLRYESEFCDYPQSHCLKSIRHSLFLCAEMIIQDVWSWREIYCLLRGHLKGWPWNSENKIKAMKILKNCKKGWKCSETVCNENINILNSNNGRMKIKYFWNFCV